MKAIVQCEYGSTESLTLEEVEKPSPGDDEVLVKVVAASVNGSDWEGLTGKPLYARLGGLRRPGNQLLGSDISGRVEEVGQNVSMFHPGDEVFGEMAEYRGGFAEYACTTEALLAHKPPSLTFEQAAAIPQGAGIALQGIRDRQVRPGQQVLINGAGGSAGTFSVQLAKHYGAEVTGVDNTGKLDFLRSLGADHVVDYTRDNFTKNGRQYDLILDIHAQHPVFSLPRALKPGGRYYLTGGPVSIMLQVLLFGPWIRKSAGKEVHLLIVRRRRKDLEDIIELYEAGKVIPVIDRQYSLEEVPQALQYVGEGHARGKVVIRIA